MSKLNPSFHDDDYNKNNVDFKKYTDPSIDSDKNDLCEMFLLLSPGLRDIVVNILKNAENKSKIYSDILTLLKTTRELYLMKMETLNKKYMETLERTWKTTIKQKQRLDTIIEYAEFFNIYPTGKEDLFFENFYNSCIKPFINHSGGKSQKGKSKTGKRKKGKSQKGKSKSKSKKSKK